ncbi:MAG: hypothetical protein OEZ06_16875 [Myxococcales bacterium]|nr:hypothetical protein [Myxococcales bacterium]
MFRRLRVLPLLLVSLLLPVAAGCKSFKDSLLDDPGSAGNGGGGGAGMDAGPDSGGAGDGGSGDGMVRVDGCVPADESCNGRDDDCDSTIDEGAEVACAEQRVNSVVSCIPTTDGARCVVSKCEDGYWSCDGNPANGCEAFYCDCHDCPDAGGDDAGK